MAKGVWGEEFQAKKKKKIAKKNVAEEDFPGGPVVKNLSSNAGDVGLIPGWKTKIPPDTRQQSLQAHSEEREKPK